MNTLPTHCKISYVVSIWREAEQESAPSWKGDLETAAGQHLNFASLSELNHLLSELGGWIDPPVASASIVPHND